MIEVEKLEKNYGPARALKGISFDVQRGDVLGFLGPNGAGKSTTMKVLSGYLLPTGGRASIDNLDVVKDSLEVRRRIGYLPESTPLYTEMLVLDYLRFVGRIRGVTANRLKAAVDRVVDLCGLRAVTGKNILELSKGYKQRVGLAQAMIHEPDVLILDEPTSGLDPNQIVEVRSLIMRLGEQHTVILSTHYLQEVEASCSRVIIVSQGEIVADDTCANLVSDVSVGAVQARISGTGEQVSQGITASVPGATIEEIGRDGDYGCYRISGLDESAQAGLAEVVVRNGWSLAEIKPERASLEDVFRKLTLEASRRAGDA